MDKKTKGIIFRAFALFLVGVLCFGLSATFGTKKHAEMSETKAQVQDGEITTFLFLGTDREAGLCDVMMLASIDSKKGALTLIQIPRDTYAAYTERSYKKLNGAYAALGGAANTADFFGEAMGIHIDHYVCMGLDALCDMVDALGGVDIDIPCDMRYSDPEQGLYINFKKGMTHLDGALAEKFVRYRANYTEGDIGRLDAQKLFMVAVLEKVLTDTSYSKILALCEAAEGVETDMTVADLVSIAMRALSVDKSKMTLLTLPGAEATATESGASYYVLSAPATAEITARFFGRTLDFDANEVFLNKRYKTFESIYKEYSEYETYSVGEISENGVDIKTRR
ncbi:MAG: LytR family transcriptional regulator [Ruminococcaceae bacterium]|nr:LytR family transcriptional regulator [Oscillospiraceae bacterium]